jgi:predicted DNA-binding transcriptional regulator YafY
VGATSALAKIAATLPKDRRAVLESSRLFAPNLFVDPRPGERLEEMRREIKELRVAEVDYRDTQGTPSLRRVRRLKLYFWDDAWSLATW